MEGRKYLVTVNGKLGTCNNDLFEKMAKKGDLTSIKVSEIIGKIVTIIGYANCTIETNEKKFDITYYDTEEYGLISTGSQVFLNSVESYYDEVDKVRITEVKTKKGKTYKAVPILENKKSVNNEETTNNQETTNNEEETTNKLPF